MPKIVVDIEGAGATECGECRKLHHRRMRVAACDVYGWVYVNDADPDYFYRRLPACLAAEEAYKRLKEALHEIAKGRGAYSHDPLSHAENCIEEMKGIAKAALAPFEEAPFAEPILNAELKEKP